MNPNIRVTEKLLTRASCTSTLFTDATLLRLDPTHGQADARLARAPDFGHGDVLLSNLPNGPEREILTAA